MTRVRTVAYLEWHYGAYLNDLPVSNDMITNSQVYCIHIVNNADYTLFAVHGLVAGTAILATLSLEVVVVIFTLLVYLFVAQTLLCKLPAVHLHFFLDNVICIHSCSFMLLFTFLL